VQQYRLLILAYQKQNKQKIGRQQVPCEGSRRRSFSIGSGNTVLVAAEEMKVVLLALLLFVCVQNVAASASIGRLLIQSVVGPKKGKTPTNRSHENAVHNDKAKIGVEALRDNVAVAGDKPQPTTEKATKADDFALAKRQDSFLTGQQMALSVLTMLLSRVIFKLDFKNPEVVLQCRVAFCAYVLLSQVSISHLATSS
jgi:hypothetical protein